ncbi:hypothetical protein EDB29_1011125 [Vibrio crassostreae]|uniref:Mom family adenine methylcarbamoylation protein n=1 Tax=Vibrio crassostreae TaxID=246167 RepID=UPI001050D59D|nr:hypothetical protein [Vibrio crassostreae]CAH6850578.1 conserved hypothetical protein [Vibrio chagasii]TCT44313.1 hypothetical protein EDB29_1011125 [Vibrio crassostreae]CAH6862022.1 conserved hypothetical protein [Vibrio chagasii]CAH6926121.1 conserved hypothetical protein [Vibrio chagasii]CAH6945232.1 conserved hypothetical protein [Vibrio chagasii]
MASAKDIVVKPIKSSVANQIIKKVHYSGKVCNNSQLHLGVFLNGKLEGAMQFGPSLDKRKIQGLVKGTLWNEFIELNRMAFSDALPRNSESRAIGVALRIIKKSYPQIKWVISFSDGSQCGDGTIYRASGFKLVQIKENSSLLRFPNGAVIANITLQNSFTSESVREQSRYFGIENKQRNAKEWIGLGAEAIKGYQLKYVYFIDKSCEGNLVQKPLPFSAIDDIGAGMYKGNRIAISERRDTRANSDDQLESGGSIPTITLQSS